MYYPYNNDVLCYYEEQLKNFKNNKIVNLIKFFNILHIIKL